LKIVSFKTKAVKVPRAAGPLSGGADSAPFVALTIKTDEGIEGISYAGFISDVMLKALNDSVYALTEQAIGSDPMDVEAIGKRLLTLGGTGVGCPPTPAASCGATLTWKPSVRQPESSSTRVIAP